MLHKSIPVGDIHGIHNWAVVDIAARDALVVAAADVGKVVKVGVDYFVLTTIGTPNIWVELTNKVSYVLPIASPAVLGGAKESATWVVDDATGVASVPSDASKAGLATVNAFSKHQYTVPVALNLAAPAAVPVDANLSNVFHAVLNANITLEDPTNLVKGMKLYFELDQDPTGSRTIAYGPMYKFAAGADKLLSTAAKARDFLIAYYDGTILRCVLHKGFVAEVTDPFYANVGLLMHMDGADGANVFTCEKGRAITLVGTPVTAAAGKKFGTASAKMLAATARITAAANVAMEIAPLFTLEAFVKFNISMGSDRYFLTFNTSPYLWVHKPAGKDNINVRAGATTHTIAHVFTLAEYFHLAITRDTGNILRVFINGVKKLEATNAFAIGASDFSPTGNDAIIGIQPEDWFLDEVRYTKGVCRYAADFVPPAEPFPNA